MVAVPDACGHAKDDIIRVVAVERGDLSPFPDVACDPDDVVGEIPPPVIKPLHGLAFHSTCCQARYDLALEHHDHHEQGRGDRHNGCYSEHHVALGLCSAKE